jgi:hypothetical protein
MIKGSDETIMFYLYYTGRKRQGNTMTIVRKDHDQCHTVTRGEVEMWKLELDPGRPVQKGRNTVETVVIDTWLKGNDLYAGRHIVHNTVETVVRDTWLKGNDLDPGRRVHNTVETGVVETWLNKGNGLGQGHTIKTGVVETWFKQGNDLDQGHTIKTDVIETWFKQGLAW